MVIRRVSPVSCAKVAGILYALLGLIIGAMISLVALAGGFSSGQREGAIFGTLFGVGAIIAAPIFYGVLGFVFALISAGLYNMAAGWVGGIEIDAQ
jgi:hypothetical protein